MRRYAAFLLALLFLPLTVEAQPIDFGRSYYNTFTVGTLTVTLGRFADGSAATPSAAGTNDPNTGLFWPGSDNLGVSVGGSARFYFQPGGIFYISSSAAQVLFSETYLMRNAAGYLELRYGTNPTGLYVDGTWTNASNYERGIVQTGTTGLILGHVAAGTGTVRPVRLQTGSTTALMASAVAMSATDEAAKTVLSITVPADSICTGIIQYNTHTSTATEIQGHTGRVSFIAYEDPGETDTYVCSVDEEATLEHTAVTAGTVTDAWSCVNAATTEIQVTPNSSLNVASDVTLNVVQNSGCVLTPGT